MSMSSVSRLFHFRRIIHNLLHRLNFLKIPQNSHFTPDRGKITIYRSNFQQVNLTPNGGVSPTVLKAEPGHRIIRPTSTICCIIFISVTVCVYPSFSMNILWYVVDRITKKTAFLQI